MAKKNKSPIPQKPVSTPGAVSGGGLLKGLMSTVNQTAELLGIKHPEWSEEIFQRLQNSLANEPRQEFERIITEFMEFGNQLRKATEAAGESKSEFENLLSSLDSQKEEQEKTKNQFETKEKALIKKESELANNEAALLTREREMLLREANAASGFAKESRQGLEKLTADLADLAEERLAMVAEMRDLRQRTQKQIDEIVLQQKQVIEVRQQELEKQAIDLTVEKQMIEQQRRRFEGEKRTADQLEATLRQQIHAEFAQEFEMRDASSEKQERLLAKLNMQLENAYAQLDEFHDLASQLSGRSPSEILKEIDQLRLEIREKDSTIYQLQSDISKDDTAALRADRDRLEGELRELRPEHEDLKLQNHRVRLGVLDKENWELEKRLLQKKTELMDAGLSDLEARINGLTDAQEHQGAFPEFGRMDRESEFQISTSTQAVGDLKLFTEELRERIAASQPQNPLFFPLEDLQLFVGGLAMSQLHVLQGISGTGKTSLAKAFAKVVGGECTDIAVQAGWRDRADLLGHYNAFERRYYEKDCLQALYKAQTPGYSDRLNVILLDEMNLSRPEQYFADFLSALEKSPRDRRIPLMESGPQNAPKLLRMGRDILVPENVWFIGTANQDETTNELADKTHDRAFVMELHSRHKGQVFEPKKDLGQACYSFQSLKDAFFKTEKNYRKETTEILELLNNSQLTAVLETQFGLGWGNRLQRQALKFLPVVHATGGAFDLALDHLISTRIFRTGKVTGRYDVTRENLIAIQQALDETWKKLFPNSIAIRCTSAIERDIKRLERGG